MASLSLFSLHWRLLSELARVGLGAVKVLEVFIIYIIVFHQFAWPKILFGC